MSLDLFHCPELKLYGEPGEPERDFKARLQQAIREQRDAEVDTLRRKYQTKLDRLETKLDREQRELEEDKAEHAARKREEVISAGETIIGMLGVFGRRRRSTGLSTASRKRRMTARAKEDVEESVQEIERLQEELAQLRQQMEQDAQAIGEKWDDALAGIETYQVKPRRSDVKVDLAALAWVPMWEITHESIPGHLTQQRIAAWRA
jgi:hypothetical protein